MKRAKLDFIECPEVLQVSGGMVRHAAVLRAEPLNPDAELNNQEHDDLK